VRHVMRVPPGSTSAEKDGAEAGGSDAIGGFLRRGHRALRGRRGIGLRYLLL